MKKITDKTNTELQHPIVDVMPTTSSINTITPNAATRHPGHSNKEKALRIVAIIIAIALVVIAGILIYRRYHKKAPITPEQTLQDLKDSSNPVTATPKTRAVDLKTTEKQSSPVKATVDDRQSMLNALK